MPPNNNNRPIVLYKQLVDLAHKAGLVGVTTELLQLPDETNGRTAIFRATVTMEQDGRTKLYQGTGDASPTNVSQQMVHCLIRLAETRSIARALRIAVNVGDVGDAELAGYEEAQPVRSLPGRIPFRGRPGIDLDAPVTKAQVDAINSLYRRHDRTAPDISGMTVREAQEEIKRLQERAA